MAWRCLSPGFPFFSIRQNAKQNHMYLCIDTCTSSGKDCANHTDYNQVSKSFLGHRNFRLMFICLVLIFNVSGKINDTDTLTGIIA